MRRETRVTEPPKDLPEDLRKLTPEQYHALEVWFADNCHISELRYRQRLTAAQIEVCNDQKSDVYDRATTKASLQISYDLLSSAIHFRAFGKFMALDNTSNVEG